MVKFGKTLQATKFGVLKTLNPDTSKESGITTDFSFVVWGEITADYLVSAKKLDTQRFQQIFDAALRSVTHSSGKYERAMSSAADKHSKSHRAQLHSDSDSEDNEPVVVLVLMVASRMMLMLMALMSTQTRLILDTMTGNWIILPPSLLPCHISYSWPFHACICLDCNYPPGLLYKWTLLITFKFFIFTWDILYTLGLLLCSLDCS